MYQNPLLAQALIDERVARLRDSAETANRRRRDRRRRRVAEAARQGAGWLLVDAGLRLVVARDGLRHPPLSRARLGLGHRSRSG